MKGVDKIMDIKTARAQLLVALPTFDANIQKAIKIVLNIEEPDNPDLTIKEIDERHVEFNGRTYYKRKNGYYSRVEWLHVAIYEANNNLIVPKGYEIHHKNLNNEDNNIDNLKMLTKAKHKSLHMNLINNFGNGICEACGELFKINNLKMRFCSLECQSFVNRHKLKGHLNNDGSFKMEYLQSKGGKHMLTCGELARKYVRLHPTAGYKVS